MKAISLTYVLLAAIPLVQTLVEAGAYTFNACADIKSVFAWDSDGGYGSQNWVGNANTIYVGVNGGSVFSKMTYSVNNAKKTATITYRGQTLKFKKPNNEIRWNNSDCLQFWGSY